MGAMLDGKRLEEFNIEILRSTKRAVLPEIQNYAAEIPGRAGSFDFGGKLEARQIDLECAIICKTKDELINAVRQFAAYLLDSNSRPKTMKLVFDDESDKFYLVRCTSGIEVDRFVRPEIGTFTISFTAYDPFAYSIEDVIEAWTAISNNTHGIYNNGSAEALPSISIKASYAEIENPSLAINDTVIIYNATIPYNSELVINSDNYTIYKGMDRDIMTTGGYDPSEDSALQFVDGEFPTLLPGPNSIVFSCENGVQADIKIQFKERWI